MNFPIIKKFTIESLSLYTRNIERVVYPGLNMIVGGNGIGKTTLVNAILFALVGNAGFDTGKAKPEILIEEGYFKGRIETKDQENARVSLTFSVNGHEITIIRALFRPRMLKFEVVNDKTKKHQIYEGDPANLEEDYQNLMSQMLGVKRFEHFVFIVANLFTFGEERQTLMWNSQAQNRIIRLLFLESQFDERFDQLVEQETRYDTIGRHKSETRKDIRRAIERWLEQKNQYSEDTSRQPELTKENLELLLSKRQIQADSIEDEIIGLDESLEEEISQLRTLTVEGDQIELAQLPLAKKLEELENEFYSSVYQSVPPEYVLVLETLTKHGTCSICGTSHKELAKLGQSLKEQGLCLVCRSPVEYLQNLEQDEGEGNLSIDINTLRGELDQLESRRKACTEAQSKTYIEINGFQEAIAGKKRQQRHLQSEIAELRSKHVLETGREPFDSAEDPWLEQQHLQIQQLETEIEKSYLKRDEAKAALYELNKELENTLNEVNEELTPLFSHFASRFLGTGCELIVSQKSVRRKPVSFMYPRFYDKERNLITQVSESQRFFLDQAFRMALITWFAQREGNNSFYIIETPEGSLDLAYERNVADMFTEFASYGHSIIVTSNLNSSNFLRGLYEGFENDEERTERTLDLFQYGRLSSVQKQTRHLKDFNDRLRQLGLPLLQPEDIVSERK